MRKAEQDILMGIASQNRRGIDCLTTCRNLLKSDAERLVKSGHVVARQCARVDDNGSIREPGVWTTGYELTELGRSWLEGMVAGPDGYAIDPVKVGEIDWNAMAKGAYALPCPHPTRGGRHEVYCDSAGKEFCRACGRRPESAVGDKTK